MDFAFARRVTCLTSLLVAGALSGCVIPQHHLRPSEIRPLDYSTGPGPGTRVTGLREAMRASADQPVHVLVVHGMRTFETEYSARLQRGLARRLGLRRIAHFDPTPLRRGYDPVLFSRAQPFAERAALPESTLRKSVWADPKKPSAPPLVFYEMLWAPARDHVKNRFFGCFETGRRGPPCTPFSDARPNTDPRILVNRKLKNDLMVDGFADATIVLGPAGDVLRDDLGLALCYIADDVLSGRTVEATVGGVRCDPTPRPGLRALARDPGTLADVPFFVMTHSLGSFLVIDAQDRFALGSPESGGAREDEAANFAFHLLDGSTVFMRANQFALLNLARLSAECASGGDPCPNPSFQAAEADTGSWGYPPRTTYVAFNDVHDLLGFELPPYLPDVGRYGQLVNVSVRNPGFYIPFLFKWPTHAHQNSDWNPAVLEAMVEGFALPPVPPRARAGTP